MPAQPMDVGGWNHIRALEESPHVTDQSACGETVQAPIAIGAEKSLA